MKEEMSVRYDMNEEADDEVTLKMEQTHVLRQ